LDSIPKNQRQVRLTRSVICIWHNLNTEHLEA
jgi:hypothetical protein